MINRELPGQILPSICRVILRGQKVRRNTAGNPLLGARANFGEQVLLMRTGVSTSAATTEPMSFPYQAFTISTDEDGDIQGALNPSDHTGCVLIGRFS